MGMNPANFEILLWEYRDSNEHTCSLAEAHKLSAGLGLQSLLYTACDIQFCPASYCAQWCLNIQAL
jgi:hypothetical protein